jgi:hypothetical protein
VLGAASLEGDRTNDLVLCGLRDTIRASAELLEQSHGAFPGQGSSTHEAIIVHPGVSHGCATQICVEAHIVPDRVRLEGTVCVVRGMIAKRRRGHDDGQLHHGERRKCS